MNRLKSLLSKILSSLGNGLKSGVGFALKKFIKHVLLNPVLHLVLGFLVGARMYETGSAAKLRGSLKGATVYVSGPCNVDGQPRKPSLAEDQVKVTGLMDGKILGVMRATREVVECDLDKVALDTLPVLSKFLTAPSKIPELDMAPKSDEMDKVMEGVLHKTIIASGVCKDKDGQELSPFTDEMIDVLSTDRQSHGFILKGIRRSDKIAVNCENSSIKYIVKLDSGTPKSEKDNLAGVDMNPVKKSYVGDVLLVTSTCFPDPRVPKTKDTQKIIFYQLVNSKVQITEESMDSDGKLVRIAGAALQYNGMVICDSAKYPLTYKLYDPGNMKLEELPGADKKALDQKGPQESPSAEESKAGSKGKT